MLRQHLRDRSSQRRLAVINMPNRSYVDMRFGTIKFFLRHRYFLLGSALLLPGGSFAARAVLNLSRQSARKGAAQ
jgi:hypothetical protein